MQKSLWVGMTGALILIGSCFLPWATIPGRGITITGFSAEGTDFGKPGLFHLVLALIYLLLLLAGKVWSLRIAFFLCVLNIAWAVRNLFIIPACHGGVCPEKHLGLYLSALMALVMIAIFFFLKEPVRGLQAPTTPETGEDTTA